jgi:hypothetical protein
MINITNYCKLFDKKAASFLDNPRIKDLIKPSEFRVFLGCRGFTEIDEKHLKEFFLWLHPRTRQMVLDGSTIEEIQTSLGRIKSL